jgi:hypothetical protein
MVDEKVGVACCRNADEKIHSNLWSENQNVRNHLENLDIDMTTLLKWVLKHSFMRV